MQLTSMANGSPCAPRARRHANSISAAVLCLLTCAAAVCSAVDATFAQETPAPAATDTSQPAAPAFVPVQDVAAPTSVPSQASPSVSPPATVSTEANQAAGTVTTPSGAAAPPATTPAFSPPYAETPATDTVGAEAPATITTPAPEPGASTGADGAASASDATTPGDGAAPAPAAPAANNPALPHSLSPWGMFMAADVVVKAVMIGLAIASFATWTVWFAKAFELSVAKRRVRRTLKQLRTAVSLGEALDSIRRVRGTGAYLVREAAEEMRASQALIDFGEGADGIKERVTSRLNRVEADAGRRLTRGTGVLATIGATAPFVGLFGTVWGIMNSFIGIAETKTTNLAVVAPGIAEALLATAIGLVAAIPAVIIYNNFARSIAGYRLELANTSALIERLVSRDLDFNRMQREHQQQPANYQAAQAGAAGAAAPHATPANLGAPVAGSGSGTAFAAE